MATSSIFDKFIIDSDEKLKILLNPVNEKKSIISLKLMWRKKWIGVKRY